MPTPASPTRPQLRGNQLRHLRALAHALKPVVQVGKNGWSEGVRDEIDGALEAHELIKVRLGAEAPTEIAAIGVHIESETDAHVVQTIGRTLVVYRRHPTKPKIELPKRPRR